jgi:hypothetical protein
MKKSETRVVTDASAAPDATLRVHVLVDCSSEIPGLVHKVKQADPCGRRCSADCATDEVVGAPFSSIHRS